MSTRVQLVGFVVDSDGNPLANGSLNLRLNADANIDSNYQIAANVTVIVALDSSGSPVNAFVWPTDAMVMQNGMTPSYRLTAFTAEGQQVFGPKQVTLPSGSTYDVSNWGV